jgi:hypothetical protein
LVAGYKGDLFYIASEEAGIREICEDPERVWQPRGGEPVVARLETPEKVPGVEEAVAAKVEGEKS